MLSIIIEYLPPVEKMYINTTKHIFTKWFLNK